MLQLVKIFVEKIEFFEQVAAVQHSIVKLTTDKISIQRDAIIEKVTKIIEAAAASKVNVICFQEAWSEFLKLRFQTNKINNFNEY